MYRNASSSCLLARHLYTCHITLLLIYHIISVSLSVSGIFNVSITLVSHTPLCLAFNYLASLVFSD